MPTPFLRELAKRHKLDLPVVEGYWNECKSGIKPGEKGRGYGLVVDCVKDKIRNAKKK